MIQMVFVDVTPFYILSLNFFVVRVLFRDKEGIFFPYFEYAFLLARATNIRVICTPHGELFVYFLGKIDPIFSCCRKSLFFFQFVQL
jgi:hypothetical protein